MPKLNTGETRHIIFFATKDNSPATGLTPALTIFKRASDQSSITPLPSIQEIGGGWYKFTFTPDSFDDFYGLVDTGLNGIVGTEKYIPVLVRAADGLVFYATENGLPKTGLTLTVTSMYKTDGTPITPLPTVSELSDGFYKLTGFTPERKTDYVAQIQTGVSGTENFIPFAFLQTAAANILMALNIKNLFDVIISVKQ